MSEQGRPSAVQPHVKLERRVSPFFATFFYGFILLAAWVWLDRGYRIWLPDLFVSKFWLRDIAIGVGVALVFAAATPILSRRFQPVRDLEREFGWILGEQRKWEILYLAILSGVAEEAIFRGGMYRGVGPVLSTIVFAAVHWPVNWTFRLWPVLALVAGLVLTAERKLTDSLLAPAITHGLINAINLFRITRLYREWKE